MLLNVGVSEAQQRDDCTVAQWRDKCSSLEGRVQLSGGRSIAPWRNECISIYG